MKISLRAAQMTKETPLAYTPPSIALIYFGMGKGIITEYRTYNTDSYVTDAYVQNFAGPYGAYFSSHWPDLNQRSFIRLDE